MHLLKYKNSKLYFQAYGEKILKIYNKTSKNTDQIRKLEDETVRRPGISNTYVYYNNSILSSTGPY